MDLGDIDSGKLRSAISQCKSALDCSMEKQILSELSNESIWKSDSKKTLVNGIKDLINVIEKLKASLEGCNALADIADEYKACESENKSLNGKIKKLKSERDGMFKDNSNSKSGNELDVYNKYNSNIKKCKNKISANRDRMTKLEKQAGSVLAKVNF